MKKIKIKGGLGNQLFQYAYGRKLTLTDKQDVIFDISFFDKKSKDTHRLFLLNKFNVDSSIKFNSKKEYLITSILKKVISKITGDYGLYQSENYFKQIENTLRQEFTLKDALSATAQLYANQITQEQNSVSIHIRRGDYILNKETNSYHGTCEIDYYEKAIQHIESKIQSPTFFIFSDDIEWAKENLKIEGALYVSNPSLTECEELILMSKCKHNIIANSSFSWWGAWLNTNPEKINIGPLKWFNDSTRNEKFKNILPSYFVKL